MLNFQFSSFRKRYKNNIPIQNIVYLIPLFIACLLSLYFYMGTAFAQPAVDGNTISWPNDGWYQVQNATNYSEICQGGSSCTVPDGTYNVINLTTGERFEGIAVSIPITDIIVSGNTISWPDNGWYQVQNAVDYSEICQGGRSCEAADGTYNVINLTTGDRFESIVVPKP